MTESIPAFSLAKRLAESRKLFTAWCGLSSPIIAEIIARQGFAAVTIDLQHGLWDAEATFTAIAAIRHASAAPIVRIPISDYAFAARALDCGAEGVIAPMINTAKDAQALVSATKYPPLGARSWGAARAIMLANIKDPGIYLREANTACLIFAMIETREALDNLEDIAKIDGIDALFVGPYDLSIALTKGATIDPYSPLVEKELERVLAVARKNRKIAGIYCGNTERALMAAKQGFQFIVAGNDTGFLRAGLEEQAKELNLVKC
jgi:4-hydroxy-2-oxoheptanedioate aldolase